jgi:pimeloyl-ACP methyl ester carboxylesterase
MTYVLVPGAGGSAWYWHRLVPELRRTGHEAIAVDLPAAVDEASLHEYADAIVAAAGDREQVVLVAQSMGGLSAPLACDRLAVTQLVLVNAMIPRPGETAATGGPSPVRSRPAASSTGARAGHRTPRWIRW